MLSKDRTLYLLENHFNDCVRFWSVRHNTYNSIDSLKSALNDIKNIKYNPYTPYPEDDQLLDKEEVSKFIKKVEEKILRLES